MTATGGDTICANDELDRLRVDVRYRGGKRLSTLEFDDIEVIRGDEVAWWTELGAIQGNGLLAPPRDRTSWIDRPVRVRVAVIRKPTLVAGVDLQPRYDCGLVRANGHDGPYSERGERGASVDVTLGYLDLPKDRRWVVARVAVGAAAPAYYVIDPGGRAPGAQPAGRFVVDARGGTGGHGVTGSSGSAGHDGSSGSDGLGGSTCSDGGDGGRGGDGGNGGDGGHGGDGGDGGDGGIVTVRFDARFPELARAIDVRVDGGAGGPGGRGGSGGRGGQGGHGGSGGSAGSTDGKCMTRSGSSGSSGSDGRSGSSGFPGADGHPGRSGAIHTVPAAASALFGDLPAGGPRPL